MCVCWAWHVFTVFLSNVSVGIYISRTMKSFFKVLIAFPFLPTIVQRGWGSEAHSNDLGGRCHLGLFKIYLFIYLFTFFIWAFTWSLIFSQSRISVQGHQCLHPVSTSLKWGQKWFLHWEVTGTVRIKWVNKENLPAQCWYVQRLWNITLLFIHCFIRPDGKR